MDNFFDDLLKRGEDLDHAEDMDHVRISSKEASQPRQPRIRVINLSVFFKFLPAIKNEWLMKEMSLASVTSWEVVF